MKDVHMHLERGSYTKEYLDKFVNTALERNIDEIWVLEHTHRFDEFMPIYQQVIEVNQLQYDWVTKKKTQPLKNYTDFIDEMKKLEFPIKIRFGLEVCYFPQHEAKIKEVCDSYPFDFIVGSIHYIDDMAYDLAGISEETLWNKYDADWIYDRYFDLTEQLIKSNLFDGLAHPDTIKMFHIMPSYPIAPRFERIAQLLNEHNMYTENNVGCYYRYHHEDMGLSEDVLEVLKRHRVRLYCATDSHSYDSVGIHLDEVGPKTLTEM